MLSFFGRGFILGFSIAAPVGPIGILCIRRSLAGGWKTGFATGLGAATADAFYGAVAAFGLTAISRFLLDQRFWLALFGGLFLCYLGASTARSKPASAQNAAEEVQLGSAYLSTTFLTLSNPATILSFIAVFAGFGLAAAPSFGSAGLLVAGVFAGSAMWWLLLSGGVSVVRARFESRWLRAANVLSGCILFAFGAYALSTAFRLHG